MQGNNSHTVIMIDAEYSNQYSEVSSNLCMLHTFCVYIGDV
jgi:hypothetical protein